MFSILFSRSDPAEWNMHCCFPVPMCLPWNIVCARAHSSAGLQCLVSVGPMFTCSLCCWSDTNRLFLSVCMGGVWNCTENNCTGVNDVLRSFATERWMRGLIFDTFTVLCLSIAECSVVGDVFVTTFDGRMFLQPGACQYVLAKSRTSSRFSVTLQYTTCAEVLCIWGWTHTHARTPP